MSRPCADASRRRFLQQAGTLAAGAAALSAASSCSLIYDSELRLGPLAQLRQAGHWVKEFNWDLIFTSLDAQGQPFTLSMVCSHKQCTVRWQPGDKEFQCPCHQGRYTPNGEVLSGKPPEPLRAFRTELRPDPQTAEPIVWVLNEEAPQPAV